MPPLPSAAERSPLQRPYARACGGRPRALPLLLVLVMLALGGGVVAVGTGLALVSHAGGSSLVSWQWPSIPAPQLPKVPREAGALAGATPGPATACTATDRDVYGDSLVVAPNEWICGHANVYGGSATVLGHVGGDVTVVGGSVTIAGEVDGSVTTIGGDVHLVDGATVGGDVKAWGGSVRRDAGVVVRGSVGERDGNHRYMPSGPFAVMRGPEVPWLSVILWALGGALLARFFPEQLGQVRVAARRGLGLSLLVGALAFLGAVIVGAVLFVTCIGIPLALLLWAATWLAWVVGTIGLGYWLGERVLRRVAPGGASVLIATVLGVTILSAVKAIPCLGGVLGVAINCAGLGAALLTLSTHRRYRRAGLVRPLRW